VGALAGALILLAAAVVADNPEATPAEVVIPPLVAAVFTAGGLVAAWRRPHNRFGLLMVATGMAFLASGLSEAALPGPRAAGLVLDTLPLAMTLHLLMAFPSGRVDGRAPRAVVAAGYTASVVLQVPQWLLAGDSVLQAADAPGAADALFAVQAAVGLGALAGAIVLLARRIARAPARERRTLRLLDAYGLLALLVTLAAALAADTGLADEVGVVQTPVLMGLPLAFLIALSSGGFARAGELGELVARIDDEGPDALRTAIAGALGDDGARVLFARDDGTALVDEAGRPAGPPWGEGRRAAEVRDRDRVVGAIVYDAGLIADEALVDEVARVAGLAIARRRLTAELRAALAELARSRRRIVVAGDEERRRIARDLHDGAQQRIVALGLDAQRIARRAEDPERVRVAAGDLTRGLADVLDELRALVHGIMPAPLVERGAEGAARWLAGRTPIPVAVAAEGLGARPAPEVEATAYFVMAESLANTVKYARATAADVRLSAEDGDLVVRVSDDGEGGADPAQGSGLRGLADRVEALGGTLRVDSPPGAGTTVEARIPCAS
jgi:signal transduction histidine kinase